MNIITFPDTLIMKYLRCKCTPHDLFNLSLLLLLFYS